MVAIPKDRFSLDVALKVNQRMIRLELSFLLRYCDIFMFSKDYLKKCFILNELDRNSKTDKEGREKH